jgi:hypothetical protein
MKKASIICLAVAQVALLIGMAVTVVSQNKSQERMNRGLGELASAIAGQEKQIHGLDQSHAAVSRQMDASVASLQSISEQLTRLGGKQEMTRIEQALVKVEQQVSANTKTRQQEIQSGAETTKRQLESIQAKISEKPIIQPLRWAYVDKFKLRDVARNTVKSEPLPPEQDPDQDPDLAKKLAEYESIQYKLQQFYQMGAGPPGFMPRTVEPQAANGKKKQDDYESLQIKLAGLKPPLAAYLKQKSGSSAGQDQLIDQAIRQFAEGKYDLLIDKTFGDHQIFYRSAQAVPDVTDGIAAVLREMAGK